MSSQHMHNYCWSQGHDRSHSGSGIWCVSAAVIYHVCLIRVLMSPCAPAAADRPPCRTRPAACARPRPAPTQSLHSPPVAPSGGMSPGLKAGETLGWLPTPVCHLTPAAAGCSYLAFVLSSVLKSELTLKQLAVVDLTGKRRRILVSVLHKLLPLFKPATVHHIPATHKNTLMQCSQIPI